MDGDGDGDGMRLIYGWDGGRNALRRPGERDRERKRK